MNYLLCLKCGHQAEVGDPPPSGFVLFSPDGKQVTLEAILTEEVDLMALEFECPKCASIDVQVLKYPKKVTHD